MPSTSKEVYETVKFHGSTAVEDLNVVKEYFTGQNKNENEKLNFAKKGVEAATIELNEFIKGIENPDEVVKLTLMGWQK